MTLQSMGPATPADEVGRTIAALAPWFHNVHLPSGHQTAPDHPLGDYPGYKWRRLSQHLPEDLSGWSVLDVGCNAGTMSYAFAARGADVLAVDHDEHYLRQAGWVGEQLGLTDRVELDRMNVYDLADLDATFDVVVFMGVLYHLRYPLLALDLVAEKVRRLLVLQALLLPGDDVVETPPDLTMDDREAMLAPGWPVMAFVEHALAGDPTNWWVPNGSGIQAIARSAGLRVSTRVGEDVYLCEPTGEVVQRPELDAALRRRR